MRRYDSFIEQCITRDKSIWNTVSKEKLPTFIAANKSVAIKVNKEVVNVKQEKKMMSRFLVVSQ